MKRQIFYCKSWFRAKKRPTEMWTEEKARAAHDDKKYYTALVDSPTSPHCFLEVTAKAVGVGFLDSLLREVLTYNFQEVAPGRLFLTMATHREFVGETDRVSHGLTYIFKHDGSVEIRRESIEPHKLETVHTSTDILSNFASFPLFGEYDDLINVERAQIQLH